MYERIPLSEPYIKGNEWKYIKECLDTNWVSSAGKYVDLFEQKICEYTGAKYAVACVNGTAALHIAMRLAGVQSEDEVIVPTVTFIAPINVVHYLNAEPVFMDCDAYYNLDIEKVKDFIDNETFFKDGNSYNKQTKKRISAIIPVHVFGNAVDIETLIPFCKERNIKIIEDASESVGTFYSKGEYKGKHTGTIGELGCISFNGNKIITTGGGGMILTDNAELADRAKYLTMQAKDDNIRSIHNDIGYNYRLTNIQAALGVAQLESISSFIEIKRKNFTIYKNEVEKISGLHIADVPNYASCNYWMYAMQIDKDVYGKSRDQLMKHLSDSNIQSQPLWYLNHLQKRYLKKQNYKIEQSLVLYDNTLNIPCSTNLKKEQIERIIENLK